MLALQNQPQTGNTVDDRLLRLGSERLVSGGAALGREREREPELVSQGDMEPEPELVSQGDLEPEPEPTQTTGSPETMLDEKEDGSATETRSVDADDAPDTTTEALAAETQSDVTGEESQGKESQGTPSDDQSGDQSEPQSEGEQSEGEQSEPQSDGTVSETGETQDTSTLGEPEEPPVFEGTPGGLAENGQPTFDSRLSDEMERFRTSPLKRTFSRRPLGKTQSARRRRTSLGQTRRHLAMDWESLPLDQAIRQHRRTRLIC
jgi:hypothetical protein